MKNIQNSQVKTALTLVVFTTLIFVTSFLDPMNLPKFLVLIVLGALCISRFQFKEFSKKRDSLTILIISFGFIFSQFLSALFSEDVVTGFFGDYQRRNGAMTYLCLVMLFLYISQNYSSAMNGFFTYSLIVCSAVVGGYGFIQSVGKDPVPWVNNYNPIISTLGNPNFASAIMAIFCTFLIFLLFNSNIRSEVKFLSLLIICILFYNIYKSQSRQGLVALAIGVGFGISLYFWIYLKKLRIVISLAFIFSLFLSIMGMLQMGPLRNLLYKDSVSVRGFYWRSGFEMFKHHFLLGVGPDQYGNYFKLYREPGYGLRYGFDITSNNAHSVPIQLFATTGFFGGLAYLALFLIPLYFSIKNLPKSSDKPTVIFKIGIISALVAFLAQSLISIDNIGIGIWGWLLAGICFSHRPTNSILLNPDSKKVKHRVNAGRSLVSSITIFLALIPAFLLFKSDQYARAAQTFYNVKVSDTNFKNIFLKNANDALKAKLQSNSVKVNVLGYMYDMGYQDQAIGDLQRLQVNFPDNPDILRLLININNGRKDVNALIVYRTKLRKLDPYDFNNLYNLGLLYKSMGEGQKMLEIKEFINKFASNSKYVNLANLDLNN